MLPSKPKSGLTDAPNNKTPPPPANKVGKLVRAGSTGSARSTSGSPSPLKSSRVPTKSVDSKPAVDRRPTKTNTTPDRQARATKGSDLPAHVGAFQEDLKKAKEQLVSAQQEKARALEELEDARRLAEEASEKLREALVAQKKAEESSDIARLRADELEQAGTEAARRREEWQKEFESVKVQHASDVEALRSTTQELEALKQELELNAKAKASALARARDAVKSANANAEKVNFLSAEIRRLKSLLDLKLDSDNSETAGIIRKLDSEVDALKQELDTAKAVEDKLAVMEMLVERLSTEADEAKRAELASCRLVDDWKMKAEGLEGQLAEAKQSERSALDSLAVSKKQLEDCNASLQANESEISTLRRKVELLELKLGEADRSEKSSIETLASLMKQVEEANASLQDAESETAVYRGKVESLGIEVAEVKRAELRATEEAREWKNRAESIEAQLVESKRQEKSATESLASLSKQLEERNSSLEGAESAASLRVKSLEIEVARCKQELAEAKQLLDAEHIEATRKATASNAEGFSEEKSQLMRELETARGEEEKAKKAMEGLASALHEVSAEAREAQERLFAKRVEFEDAYAQIEQLRSALKNTEENYEVMLDEARYEIVCLKKSIERFETEASDSKAQSEASTAKGWEEEVVEEDGTGMSEPRVAIANGEAAEAAKEDFLDGENELLRVSHENVEVRTLKIEELSALPTEATAENPEENGELSNSEKEYDMLPNTKEIPVDDTNGSSADSKPKEENGNGNGNGNGNRNRQYLDEEEEEPVEVEVQMLEGYRAPEKYRNLSTDMGDEEGSLDSDLDPKMESGSFDKTNGGLPSETAVDGSASPTKQQQQQHLKKKKPLFQKFGSLLKKKNNHK
ncbi:WEB family protein-like, chloroplastic [Iris pallida]|uniref:WEB family protein-like, chloroplastic n=1 Tax=Iris pallida TaxID=29817 RepID=A0AAX6FLX0_IRIPA|nr:WEB family protein-like, chloroplastic [Iris pallida]